MRRTTRRTRAGTALVVAALLTAGCTIQENNQYQVDLVPLGYHAHLYRTTTMMVWFAHSTLCGWNPACTLQTVRDQADISGVLGALSGADFFFDDDVADFDDALRATPHPWPLSINVPEQYGCLNGYKNLFVPHADGDWYAAATSAPFCKVGSAL